jgi:hypothetical protein
MNNGIITSVHPTFMRSAGALKYQAVLRKGAMLFFSQKRVDDTYVAYPFIQKLATTGGLWIDGDQDPYKGIPDLPTIVNS